MRASNKRREAMTRDYLAGMSAKALADRYNLSVGGVQANLSNWGVQLPRDERVRRQHSNGRPPVWPNCPRHMRADYETLRKYMPASEARATLEAGAR